MTMTGSERRPTRKTSAKRILLSVLGNKWFRLISLTLLALLMVFVGGRFGLKLYIDKQLQRQLGDDGYAELHDFLDSPVELSEDWFDATPFSADLIDADRAFLAEWGRIEESVSNDLSEYRYRIRDRLLTGDPVSEEEWRSLEDVSDKYSAHMASVFHLGSQPDYEMSAVRCSDSRPWLRSLSPLHHAAEYLSLRAVVEAHRGNCAEAFENAFGALQLSVRPPCTAGYEHTLASVMLALNCDTMVFLADQCDDPEALSTALKKMEELESKVNPSIPPELTLVDIVDILHMVAILRRAAKRGVPVVFHHEMTGRELFRQVQDLTEYYPEIEGLTDKEILKAASRNKFLKRLQNSLEFVLTYASSEAKQFNTTTSPMGSPVSATPSPYALNYLQKVAEAVGLFQESEEAALASFLVFSQSMRYDQRIIEILGKARSDFDLARLALAARIVELETGTRPTEQASLIPRFFQEPLVDPLTQKPYVWDGTSGTFSCPRNGQDKEVQ